jgi:hypothetical protein
MFSLPLLESSTLPTAKIALGKLSLLISVSPKHEASNVTVAYRSGGHFCIRSRAIATKPFLA